MYTRLRIIPLALALLAAVSVSVADTIFLKNGSRIVVDSATEEGDKVYYEGEFGRVSVRKALVERIEKGGPVPTRRAAVPAEAGAARLDEELAAGIRPAATDTEGVIRNDAVD
jgi:hypothetical protein